MYRCPHGYLYNLEHDELGPANRRAFDGCAPPDSLVTRAKAYEAVQQAAHDLEVSVKYGRGPGDPLECARALVARANELVALLEGRAS